MAGNDKQGSPGEDDIAPIVAGLGPDLEVQQMVEEEEMKRKRRETAEGRGGQVVVYDPGTGVTVGRTRRIVVLIFVLAIILIPVLYLVAIPRADAELIVQYNEGVMGGINVDARIANEGTRTMEDVTITILVQNSTDVRMADPTAFEGRVSAHNEASMDAISFSASQWETYHIFVEYTFDCAGKTYHGSEHYVTEGEGMNMWFYLDMTA